MKKLLVIIISLVIIASTAIAQIKVNPDITVEELKEHIEVLSSDELKGRKSGTEESEKSAKYIIDQLVAAGITPILENGFQYFELVVDAKAGEGNHFEAAGQTWEFEKDFMPYSFSQNKIVNNEVVFASYGFDIDKDSISWNDYKDVDVKGKWVMILKGDPEPDKDESVFADFSGTRSKVLTAKDKGAAGVIFVAGPAFDKDDKLVSLYYDKTQSNAGLPVINIKRNVADSILKEKELTVARIEYEINKSKSPKSFAVSSKIDASTDIILEKVKDQNVVALIEGNDPALKDSYIVIGAHYDHLGMGGQGSNSRMPDTLAVHNGADDNGSGVSGIIEIAEKISAMGAFKRSVIIIAFGAEEMGLIGSKYFVKNPPVDLANIEAMVNFDMIGRLNKDKRKLAIGGTGTAKESEDILNNLSGNYDLSLAFSPEGFGPSDHAAFYGENIPVYFISTGAHGDYHTPFDDIEYINFEGQKIVADFAYDLVRELANRAEPLTFQEAGPKTQTRMRNKLKVTLGIMPDFTSDSNDGLGVGGVTKGRPADKAGMLKGDLIVALDGMPVTNIYDYMNRLKKFKPGQIITVDVVRNGEKIVLIVQL